MNNKKVLVLHPKFDGLEIPIIEALKKAGALVHSYENKLVWFSSKRESAKSSIYSEENSKLLFFINTSNYDYFICLGGCGYSRECILKLRTNNPKIISIIYFWDSFSTWDFSLQISMFDICHSFDKEDCRVHESLSYLPFYIQYSIEDEDFVYDLCHIGSLNPHYLNRLKFILSLKSIANKLSLNWYLKLHTPFIKMPIFQKLKYIIYLIVGGHFEFLFLLLENYKGDLFISERFTLSKVLELEAKSKCILDINMDRHGLSPRIITALANNKKVILNNKYIEEESFYDSNNIYILKDKRIDYKDIQNFLFKPSKKIKMESLRIENWIKLLIGDNKYE